MQGTRRKGQVLELFDWDEHRQWRRIRTKLNNAWVALDWEQPLLRPQGVPFSQIPLEPLCQAAREGCAQDVHRFIADGLDVDVRDVSGQTPLMLAAQKEGWRGLVCCVLLLEANADPNLSMEVEDAVSFDEIAQLEDEKRRAVENEDFQRAHDIKEQLAKLNERKTAEVKTAASLAGDTAASELLNSLQNPESGTTQLLIAFDEIAALPETPEAKSIPRRVQALQAQVKHPAKATPNVSVSQAPAAQPAREDITVEDENGEPWLESPHKVEPKLLQGVLFRVQQTAPVFEEPKMSAAKLGNVRQHQLLEVLGYNSTRCFGRVEVITPEKVLEKGWVFLGCKR
ncbi:unnamed protein product [Cladocopium goreaui]|uniref:Ankyrin repeat and MYND domain-containing protein 1 n=1 Tax=Cladocopium goreaui TaxID=2562237 RepID=A0A9P1BLX2_9DINO|nr:unnamed protein product [Cladocopium goreaui]